MHEMSIASALMDQMMVVAKENNLVTIESVIIDTGMLKQIVHEVMENAFEAVTQGTIAEGAVLIQNFVEAEARCRQCDQIFSPDLDNYLCPICKKADVEIISGDEMILKSITGKEENES